MYEAVHSQGFSSSGVVNDNLISYIAGQEARNMPGQKIGMETGSFNISKGW